MTLQSSISELYNNKTIPFTVYSYCYSKSISNIKEFLEFHTKNGTFNSWGSQKNPVKELAWLLARAKRIVESQDSSKCRVETDFPISSEDLNRDISGSTSLDELFALDLIGQHTFNCCVSEDLHNVNDLLSYKNNHKDFRKIRGCGKKSDEELLDLLESISHSVKPSAQLALEITYKKGLIVGETLSPRFKKVVWDAICANVSDYEGNLALFVNRSFPNFESFYAHLYTYGSLIFETISELSPKENIELRLFFRNTINVAVTWLTEYLMLRGKDVQCFVDISIHMESIINSKNVVDSYAAMSDLQKMYLETRYQEMCLEDLSVRAKKIKAQKLPSSSSTIPHLFESKDDFFSFMGGNKISSTIEEIFIFLQNFREHYEKIKNYSDSYIENLDTTRSFPFLLSFQRKFVQQYKANYGHLPMFYILAQYLKSSNLRNDVMYSLYYGISNDAPISREEIAQKYDMTHERVRQIVASNKRPPVCKLPLVLHNDWGKYEIFNDIIITIDSPNYIALERENFKLGFWGFLGILRLFNKHEIVEIFDKCYGVKRDLFDYCDFEKLCKNITQVTLNRITSDENYHLQDFIPNWGTIAPNVRKGILLVASRLISDSFGIIVDKKGYFTIKKNTIDHSQEVLEIFNDTMRPMSVEEIAALLTVKYPQERWSLNMIRRILYSSDEIGAIGKSATYAPKAWDNVYFGNIRDLLFEILDTSKDPMHIDDIYNRVAENYPSTNKKSLSSNMAKDTYERFILFENGYFGLVGKEYDSCYIELPSEQRIPFDKRIEAFKVFVETYHRFPVSYSGETEGSLKRWLYNVTNGIVTVSPEQMAEFNQIIADYTQKQYPQTVLEVNFLDNCESVKEIIITKHRLPSRNEEIELYNWLRKYKDCYLIYDDQRKIYFEQLLKYIYSFGFVL